MGRNWFAMKKATGYTNMDTKYIMVFSNTYTFIKTERNNEFYLYRRWFKYTVKILIACCCCHMNIFPFSYLTTRDQKYDLYSNKFVSLTVNYH